MNLKFSGAGAKFLSAFMAKSDVRWYLCQTINLMPVEGGGVVGVSTNGHMLGLWYDKDGQIDDQTLITATPQLCTALGKRQRTGGDTYLTVIGENLAAVNEHTEIYIQPKLKRTPLSSVPDYVCEGKFPDVRAVLGDAKHVDFSGANGVLPVQAKYIEAIAKAFIGADQFRKGGTGLHLGRAKENDKVYIVSADAPTAVAVLMPMRKDHIEMPEFMAAKWSRDPTKMLPSHGEKKD